MSVKIAPSILAADFANLERDIKMVNNSQADIFHLDVMDGVFVPNISYGIPVIEAIKRHATKPLDVHLMIVDPGRYIEAFQKAGAEWISVHYEACTHLHRVIHQIKQVGCKAGVVLNPHTPVEVLEPVLNDLDFVLIMSVNPGFGGQKFIMNAVDKVRKLRKMIHECGSSAFIEVDGGVNGETAKLLIDAGADVLVAGSYVFSASDPEATIAHLKSL